MDCRTQIRIDLVPPSTDRTIPGRDTRDSADAPCSGRGSGFSGFVLRFGHSRRARTFQHLRQVGRITQRIDGEIASLSPRTGSQQRLGDQHRKGQPELVRQGTHRTLAGTAKAHSFRSTSSKLHSTDEQADHANGRRKHLLSINCLRRQRNKRSVSPSHLRPLSTRMSTGVYIAVGIGLVCGSLCGISVNGFLDRPHRFEAHRSVSGMA